MASESTVLINKAFRLRIDGTVFRDDQNREVTLHGINVAGDAKLPAHPDQPSHVAEGFFDGDDVSFVDRPFAIKDAQEHFSRLRRWGYNTIRYIFTWEALEHSGPGKYDEQFIQHTIEVLRIAKDIGFMVLMDPHQDVWSRFTGGSGAPMWTLYACGLDPRGFSATEAALVQNAWPNPSEFPKMVWATNYTRMACQVVITLFFGGRKFAPSAVIDGINIQDYLQNHLIAACKHLALRVREAGDLDQACVVAWESMNEPNRGLIGSPDISVIPSEQRLQKGTSPTAWQAILTGSGRPCEIDTWDFGGMGPYKSGTQLVDPKGTSAWLHRDHDDTKYGWKRDQGWRLGQCIWAQHGVWDPASDTLLKKDYFSIDPETKHEIDYEYFTNNFFMPYYRNYKDAIRNVFPHTIMFCQPPVLEIPPTLKNGADDDPNMVYAPHWYDGVTLMTKKWNRLWNVDVFGVLRGRYLTPAFAIKIGETAIRNCFKDQHGAIKKEGLDYMGLRPCVFTEFGIPYDMDDTYAYKTGDYSSQISAMDANHYGMEGNKLSFCLWVYTATNQHEWGDQWNGEDLSVFSEDDEILPRSQLSRMGSNVSVDRSSPSFSESQIAEPESTMKQKAKMGIQGRAWRYAAKSGGFRAAQAFVRPTPIATHGDLNTFGFDLKNCTFTMALTAPSSTNEDCPTEVFLPEFHFPKDHMEVEVSGGRWDVVSDDGRPGSQQRFVWWHAAGEQTLKIIGVTQKQSQAFSDGNEESFLNQCREKGCIIM